MLLTIGKGLELQQDGFTILPIIASLTFFPHVTTTQQENINLVEKLSQLPSANKNACLDTELTIRKIDGVQKLCMLFLPKFQKYKQKS